MMVETRLVGRAQVCVGAERSDRGGFRFKSSFLYFRQELIAVPVRQTNVAQNDIERISHIADILARMAPVAPALQIPKNKLRLETAGDSRSRASNFLCDEILPRRGDSWLYRIPLQTNIPYDCR